MVDHIGVFFDCCVCGGDLDLAMVSTNIGGIMKAKLIRSITEKSDYDNADTITLIIARRKDKKDLPDYRDFIILSPGDDVGTIIHKLEDLAKRLKTFCVEVK